MISEIKAKRTAEPIVKFVVDCIADKRYTDIKSKVSVKEDEAMTPDLLEEIVEDFLSFNDLPCIDKYDTPCSFNPSYEYNQLEIYTDDDGFETEYALTTNSELNDLTLVMRFDRLKFGRIKAYVLDAHVM